MSTVEVNKVLQFVHETPHLSAEQLVPQTIQAPEEDLRYTLAIREVLARKHQPALPQTSFVGFGLGCFVCSLALFCLTFLITKPISSSKSALQTEISANASLETVP